MRNNYNCVVDFKNMKLSKDVKLILKQMLQKNPAKRITVKSLLESDLFCCNVKDEESEEAKINYDPLKTMYCFLFHQKQRSQLKQTAKEESKH